MTTNPLEQLSWRCIGPYRGGRVVAVAGDPRDVGTCYFGSTGGGVWKTTDAGQYWHNVSDGYFKRASVGGLAVAPSDPHVIYAGMGESTIRGNVSHGDGVYKSTDAGQSWQHCGLAATRNIGKVRVHPTNPDLVYVAALGHAHGPNPERGLYVSEDGGRTWDLRLFRSETAGAVDVALDPSNPRVLYVATWEGRRGPHYMLSGGRGSGIFRSNDGGHTFIELTQHPGLPSGLLGRIGVTVGLPAAPSQPGRVWVIVEQEHGGVFRSDDAGDTWQCVNSDGDLRQRAWYYSHIVAHPRDLETVWVLNLHAWRSIDGGRTFQQFPAPHGDNHDLWIDRANPRRMLLGNDGGATVSLNGGESWSNLYNQPTAELYHVTLDTRTPYRVYGAQQDNTTISVPSWSAAGFIPFAECYRVGGGESAHIAVRPDDPDIAFAGDQQGRLFRYNHRTGETREVSVWPEHYWGWDAKDRKYRFNWTFPVLLSPHDPDSLYLANNHVFRSTDEGRTWQQLSPDLTRNDPTHLQPAGPIGENANGDMYGTVVALAESPLTPGIIWTGSDDGRVHLSRDNGESWQDVTPPDLPEWSYVSTIEPGRHDPTVAYLAADRHKLDDFRPLIFCTGDYGQTWAQITDGIAPDDFVRVVREDPQVPGLLYAGTETGLYISFDAGAHWQRTAGSLPVVPIHDLGIRDDDLVAATHGRSFWISSDLGLLRQFAADQQLERPRLFTPPPTLRLPGSPPPSKPSSAKEYVFGEAHIVARLGNAFLDAGSNPPAGVVIAYHLPKPAAGELRLAIHHADGREIRTFTGGPERPTDADGPALCTQPGLNRFVWDLRYADPPAVTTPGGDRMNASGARLPPGDYEARLSIGGATLRAPFHILPDPRTSASQADLEAQFELHQAINAKLAAVNTAINQIRDLRAQLTTWPRRAEGHAAAAELRQTGQRLQQTLDDVEGQLIQVNASNMEDTLRLPTKLNAKLTWLTWTISEGDGAPTQQARDLFADLARRADAHLQRLHTALATDLPAFNALVRSSGIPPIAP